VVLTVPAEKGNKKKSLSYTKRGKHEERAYWWEFEGPTAVEKATKAGGPNSPGTRTSTRSASAETRGGLCEMEGGACLHNAAWK
jgi:hypothetical protein